MIEINSSKIDKEILEKEINYILDYYEKHPKKRKEISKIDKKNKVYILEDFTKYYDIEFIQNIYKVVLNREPDDLGLKHKLELLRGGKRSKSEILALIRFSKEGREQNVPILGIKKRYILAILYKIPILGYFFKLIINLITLPRLIERLNRFESHYFIVNQEQNSKIENIDKTLNSKIEDINKSLNSKIENIDKTLNNKIKDIDKSLNNKIENIDKTLNSKIKNLELYIKEIKRAKEALIELESNLDNFIKNIKENKDNPKTLKFLEKEKSRILDELYISFEDRFRGSREDIKNRQKYYIPFIKEVIKEGDIIVDIGSGRGEWLELLKENGINSIGIDLNRLMVKESKKLGLKVICQDAISYLKSQKDNSIGGITGFHIVEHLPFEILISLLNESYRVLKEGGMVIFETPNPENILVGSSTFYTDPTHINPIPPVTLEFLAQNRGFSKVKIVRLHPIKEPSFIDIPNAQDINNLIFASTKAQDYSIIGYKL